MVMNLTYESGQHFQQYFQSGTVKVSQNAKRMYVSLQAANKGSVAGSFSLTRQDAESIGRALLLMSSTPDIPEVKFPVGEKKEKK
jgi:hypothetical protein